MTPQSAKDGGDLARFEVSSWPSRGSCRASVDVNCADSRLSACSWCRSRQPFDHVGTCWLCMPISVLPTSAVAPSHEITVAWRREDASLGIHQNLSSRAATHVHCTLYGITNSLFRRLEAVQNAIARLMRAAQGPRHSDPVAASLAPGPRTSHLQARLVGFQGVARSVAAVCHNDCQLLADTGSRQFWSSDVLTCSVLRTHSSLGDRCFAVAGPRTWNSLPIKLQQP